MSYCVTGPAIGAGAAHTHEVRCRTSPAGLDRHVHGLGGWREAPRRQVVLGDVDVATVRNRAAAAVGVAFIAGALLYRLAAQPRTVTDAYNRGYARGYDSGYKDRRYEEVAFGDTQVGVRAI